MMACLKYMARKRLSFLDALILYETYKLYEAGHFVGAVLFVTLVGVMSGMISALLFPHADRDGGAS